MRLSFGFRRIRRHGFGHFIVHGGQLLLVFTGFELKSSTGWLAVSVGIAALSVVAWLLAIRRWRVLGDTPTSHVATAAQGYVELSGRGRAMAGTPVVSPLKSLPCLWYRLDIEREDSDGKWQLESSETSDASIVFSDGTGECLLDTEGAEVISSHEDTWRDGDQRFTQWLLLEQDALYALGQFKTRSALDMQLDRDADIKQMLADWKEDNPQLLKRFDLNNDGKVDLREWELARGAARREVEKQHREARNSADLHMMHCPTDGRLYLISNIPAEKLAQRYRLLAWLHLVIFFVALSVIPMLISGRITI